LKTHIKLKSPLPSNRVLVCGAPERAEKIAGRLQDSRPLEKSREYHSYTGLHQGKPVLVLSHGVGAPGATICFQELMDCGATSIIRLGTAGGLYDETQIGDLVVATSAVRKDGVSRLMVPDVFPAVADRKLTSQILKAFADKNVPYREGMILTSDLFYPSLLDDQLAFYKKANVIAVEMECSALFVAAHLRGVRAASVLILDGNPLKWHEGVYDPTSTKIKTATDLAIEICLNALILE